MFIKILALLAALFAFLVFVVDLIFLLPTIHGAIFLPSSAEVLLKILQFAKLRKGKKVVDIGSGDGRLVIAMAEQGAEAHGYEINPILVLWSRLRALRSGQAKNAHFHWANMWRIDYSPYQVVVVFGMSYIMSDLEKKLHKELRPGTRVICNSFPFPNWKPIHQVGEVYVYEKH